MLEFVLPHKTVRQDRFQPEVIMHLFHDIFLPELFLLKVNNLGVSCTEVMKNIKGNIQTQNRRKMRNRTSSIML